MKKMILVLLPVFVVALASVARADGPVSAEATSGIPPVGTRIDARNANRYANLIPRALMFAIEHGLVIDVVANQKIDWPTDYQHDTEKYSKQVALSGENTIRNYVAGLPFPAIEESDPSAGVKVAYNWRFGPFLPKDLSFAGDQKTRAYSTDSAHPATLLSADEQRDYRNENNCEQVSLLRFDGADNADPKSKVEWKERGGQCGPDRAAVITIRYADPARSDESWGYIPVLRKWRQFMMQGGYPNQSCTYSCTQVFLEYLPPKTEAYSTRLLRVQPELACFEGAGAGSGVIDAGDAARFGQLDCEVRQAYVLDMQPRRMTPEMTLPSRVYIDAETFLFLGGEFSRDKDGEPDASVAIWRTGHSAAGGTSIALANDLYVPADRPNFFLALDADTSPAIDENSVSKVVFNPRAQMFSDGRM